MSIRVEVGKKGEFEPMHVSLPTSTNSACNTSGCSFLCSIDLISTLSLRPNLFFFSTPLFSAVTSWPWHDHGRTRKNPENIPCLCEVDNCTLPQIIDVLSERTIRKCPAHRGGSCHLAQTHTHEDWFTDIHSKHML